MQGVNMYLTFFRNSRVIKMSEAKDYIAKLARGKKTTSSEFRAFIRYLRTEERIKNKNDNHSISNQKSHTINT